MGPRKQDTFHHLSPTSQVQTQHAMYDLGRDATQSFQLGIPSLAAFFPRIFQKLTICELLGACSALTFFSTIHNSMLQVLLRSLTSLEIFVSEEMPHSLWKRKWRE
jgi:hypothetical protein